MNKKYLIDGFKKAEEIYEGDDIPECDMYSFKDFEALCLNGAFVDDDGIGEYSLCGENTGKMVSPSQFLANPNKEYCYVLWYNK